MTLRSLAAAAVVAVLAAALFLAASPARPPVAAEPGGATPAAAAPRPAPLPALSALPPAGDDPAVTREARYRVEVDFSSTIDGGTGPAGHIEGIWTVHPTSDDRLAARLDEAIVEGYEALPPAEAMAGGVELVARPDGALGGLGFPAQMPGGARNLYTALASMFWHTPGEGDAWVVEEEDAAGAFTATYTRRGAEITRRIGEWSALRGQDGLQPLGGRQVVSAGKSVFRFDDEGLVRLDVDARTTTSQPDGVLTVVSSLRARFIRLDVRPVALGAGRLSVDPIALALDPTRDRDLIDDQLIADADAAALLAEVARIDALDAAHPDTQKWRGVVLGRLAALVRQDPAVAAELAAQIRRAPEATGEVSLLLGALGSSGVAEGTNALAGLLADELPAGVERSVLTHLALADAKTPEAATALSEALDGPQGDVAGAALGAQARALADEHPEAVEGYLDALIARYLDAATPAERLAALQALGNTGSPRILPLVSGLLVADDPTLAAEAVFALRFIPGDEVDALLLGVLARGDARAPVALAAIAFRDAGLWRPRLQAALEQTTDPHLVEALQAALAQLG
ncbi:MAG: HEAT repeat domain-containing protein [bacterium]